MKEHAHKPYFELNINFVERFLNKEIRPKHTDFEFFARQSDTNDDIYITIVKEEESKTIRLTNNEKDMKKFCYVSAHTKTSKIVKLIEDAVRKMTNSRLENILDNIYQIVY